MTIKVFTKSSCPKCPPAKELAEELKTKGENVVMCSLDEPSGLAEAAMYDIMATPSIVITDNNDLELKSWRGEVPSLDEVKA